MDFFKLPAAESLDLSEEEIAVLHKIFAATGGASIGLRERGVGTEICLFHQDPSAIWLRSSLERLGANREYKAPLEYLLGTPYSGHVLLEHGPTTTCLPDWPGLPKFTSSWSGQLLGDERKRMGWLPAQTIYLPEGDDFEEGQTIYVVYGALTRFQYRGMPRSGLLVRSTNRSVY